ncbi:hypothetical protein SBRCBS47491_006201 [Sporothrix bragantina]|uniref:Zn(2)-C6 fungal-type domain-containing protein n=1 Tax=Sporothrix bragantina TaxID=671064 RepID=A0ABP0C3U6_9PEZI
MEPERDVYAREYPEERPAKRRHRSAVACRRCKSRKQKCDNEFPSCSNCVCAGESCAYGNNQMYPAEYVRSLESQIAQLKGAMGSMAARELDTAGDQQNSAGNEQGRHSPPNSTNVNSTNVNSTNISPGDVVDKELEPCLEAGVGFVALSPNSYLGTSSGFPLAKLVKSTINAPSMSETAPFRRGTTGRADINTDILMSSLSAPERHQDLSTAVAQADMPSDEIADKLIEAYFFRVHPKHAFLSRRRVAALNKNRANLRPAHQSPGHRGPDRLDYVIMHLVYAIGARYLQLANDHDCPNPEAHHAAALGDIDAILNVQSLENLEAMLLLSIYQLRSPTGPGIWWMIGTTMRHCLDCGLHRKSNSSPPLLDQRRKRIFWTAYMLERSVARTVGRPCAVADWEIDVELPANIDDGLETDDEVRDALVASAANPHQITALTAAIHITKMQQLESRIARSVCRVDKPLRSMDDPKITKLRQALEAWKANIPRVQIEDASPYTSAVYHMAQYHKALLLLFLPFLPSLTPAHTAFREVTYSAGQICQLYKRHHENQSYISYSLLALHATFVAGLVLVYCFCLDPSIFDVHFSSDIRACSTLLYTISERWTAARKVRSAFESLVAATIESHNPGHPGRGADITTTTSAVTAQPAAGPVLPPSNAETERGLGANLDTSMWDSFESVLEDYQINTETWMQDSIFLAMDEFPPDSFYMGV